MITRERLVAQINELSKNLLSLSTDGYANSKRDEQLTLLELMRLALRGLEAAASADILERALECLQHSLGTVNWDDSGAERVIREALEAYRTATESEK